MPDRNNTLNVSKRERHVLEVAGGDMRVGENLEAAIELYFIETFGIIPTVFFVRYFENNFTIDAAVVFKGTGAGKDSQLNVEHASACF